MNLGTVTSLASNIGRNGLSASSLTQLSRMIELAQANPSALLQFDSGIGGSLTIPKGRTLMQLGKFQFSIGTLAHQEISRTTQFRWASHDRINNTQAMQFTGYGEDTIELSGVTVPQWTNAKAQIDLLRAIAQTREPQLLVDGSGVNLGYWVIKSVSEKQNTLDGTGSGRDGSFSLSLTYYGDKL
jgi:uncharacterized protein